MWHPASARDPLTSTAMAFRKASVRVFSISTDTIRLIGGELAKKRALPNERAAVRNTLTAWFIGMKMMWPRGARWWVRSGIRTLQ